LLLQPVDPFPGIAAFPIVLGTMFVLWRRQTGCESVVSRFLSSPALRFVGLVSYSLYLWHWPVLNLADAYWGRCSNVAKAGLLVISFLLSIITWRWIETPLRRGAAKLHAGWVITLGAVSVIGMIALCAITKHYAQPPPRVLTFWDVLEADTTDGGWHVFSPAQVDFESLRKIGDPVSTQRDDLLVWGDSHGVMMEGIIRQVAEERGLHGHAILCAAQPPCLNVCRPGGEVDSVLELQFRRDVANWIRQKRPRNVIAIARWKWYLRGYSEIENAGYQRLPGESVYLATEPDAAPNQETSAIAMRDGLQDLADVCREVGATLWIVRQVPEVESVTTALDWLRFKRGQMETLPDVSVTATQHQESQETTHALLETVTGDHVRIIDPASHLFDATGRTIMEYEERSTYRDNDHLTDAGMQRLRPMFEKMLGAGLGQ
ncbi:MAG: acyltransferase family protein, partial [Planctomycetota bacterium]